MSAADHYMTLSIPRSASTAEIVQAYRTIISTYQSESLAAYALFDEEEMDKIRCETEEAYRILNQPERRRAYDATLPVFRNSEVQKSGKPPSGL